MGNSKSTQNNPTHHGSHPNNPNNHQNNGNSEPIVEEKEPLPALDEPTFLQEEDILYNKRFFDRNFLRNLLGLLSDEDIRFLMAALPGSEYTKEWSSLFNSKKNGKSFNRFCYHVTGRGPNLGIR
jgi:hypothetical protein